MNSSPGYVRYLSGPRNAGVVGLLIWMLGALGSPLYAQNATVRGFVTDAANGEALIGVNVVLEDELVLDVPIGKCLEFLLVPNNLIGRHDPQHAVTIFCAERLVLLDRNHLRRCHALPG